MKKVLALAMVGNGWRGGIKSHAKGLDTDIGALDRCLGNEVENLRTKLAAIDAVPADDVTPKQRRERRVAAAKSAQSAHWRSTLTEMIARPKNERHSATLRAREADRQATPLEIERAKLRLAEFAADPLKNAPAMRAAIEAGDPDAVLAARLLPTYSALRGLADRRHVANVIGVAALEALEVEEVRATLAQQRLDAFDETLRHIAVTGEEPKLHPRDLIDVANQQDELLERAAKLGVLDRPLTEPDLVTPTDEQVRAANGLSARDLLNQANAEAVAK